MKSTIGIIDYGMGNIGSIQNALKTLGYEPFICSQPDHMSSAAMIVLPGVGAFPAAMNNLKARGFIEPLNELVLERKVPFLGICLGMQLIAEDSLEQDQLTKGLGWVPGHVIRISPANNKLPVPHVGWTSLQIKKMDSPLFQKTDKSSHFYFDHEFHLVCGEEFIAATCDYGLPLVAAVQKGNVFAVQFHPEKSQRSGLKLWRSFIETTLNGQRGLV